MFVVKAILAVVLSLAWLAGQTPCLFGLLISLHGAHHAHSVKCGDDVTLVFSHESEEDGAGHEHADHVVVISADKGVRERGTSVSGADPGLDPALLSPSRLLPAKFVMAAVRPPPRFDHGPPPFGAGVRPLRL